MSIKDDWHEDKFLGSTVVSPKGQVVIPVNARKELGLDSGDTLLVFKALRGQGLVLLKVDAIEQILGMVSKRLTAFEKLVKTYQPPKTASGKKGVS